MQQEYVISNIINQKVIIMPNFIQFQLLSTFYVPGNVGQTWQTWG